MKRDLKKSTFNFIYRHQISRTYLLPDDLDIGNNGSVIFKGNSFIAVLADNYWGSSIIITGKNSFLRRPPIYVVDALPNVSKAKPKYVNELAVSRLSSPR